MARTRTRFDRAPCRTAQGRSPPPPPPARTGAPRRDPGRSPAAGNAASFDRVLAEQLDLSRGVVVEAYEQLVAEGYLTSIPGGATRVATRAAAATPARRGTGDEPKIHQLRLRAADVTLFPRQVWLRSVRRVLIEAPSGLTYLDRRGAPELREALAAYLGACRARPPSPRTSSSAMGSPRPSTWSRSWSRHVAVGGSRRGPGRLGRASGSGPARTGDRAAAVDEVDPIDALRRSNADAVFLTPAHHLSAVAVMTRAASSPGPDERGALILEDDYAEEYRYDREPIGAITAWPRARDLCRFGEQDAGAGSDSAGWSRHMPWSTTWPRSRKPTTVGQPASTS